MTDGTDWAELRAATRCYEDAAVLALNKPAGISVTGERHETDLVRMAADAGETLYPVHRIDKVTSGLILFAKDLGSHAGLTRQFAHRTAVKRYLALVRPGGLPPTGTIELPLSTGRKGRVRIAADRAAIEYAERTRTWSVAAAAVYQEVRSYPSTTEFRRLAEDADEALLAVSPVTGRRHQIRVHLAWIGHAIVGDPLFARPGTQTENDRTENDRTEDDRTEDGPADRTGLHSWRLGLAADWLPSGRLELTAEPGPDFWRLCRTDTPRSALSAATD